MILFTILLMGVIGFLLRFSFFAIPATWRMPELVERALPYVFPAVLAALLLPGALLAEDGSVRTPIYGPYMIGVAAGFVVGAFKKDSFFLVFVGSFVAFGVARWAFAA